MKPLRIAAFALVIAAAGATAGAQSNAPPAPGAPPDVAPSAMDSMPMHHPMGVHDMTGMPRHTAMGGSMAHGTGRQAAVPTEPGHAAFGAIQQVVGMLQADPYTDWSKVDVDALRQHLIDMDEVTMRAAAQKEPIDNGLSIKVTGNDRTLEAIQRMVPEHARDIDGMYGWTVRTTALPNGVELTVTASNPADVQKIRSLGYTGIMVQGSHHQMHHLAMAKREPLHIH